MIKLHYIIITVVAVALVGMLYLFQHTGNGQAQAGAGNNLYIAESFYDFGTIGLDSAQHAYTIKNTGVAPIHIRKISTSCGCTTAKLQKEDGTTENFGMDHGGTVPYINVELKPGEEAQVIATYNPLAHGLARAAGSFNRSIYILTDNPRQEYELRFTVNVDPGFSDESATSSLQNIQ